MDTYFASAERISGDELKEEVDLLANNVIINELMRAVGGILVVLNEHRQIIAANDTTAEFLGITEPSKMLGLRHGEVLGCIHSNEMPGGCGTSRDCGTCGLIKNITSSLKAGRPEETTCAIEGMKAGQKRDWFFRVRSSPIRISETDFVLVLLQDISYQQNFTALENVFFHDLKGIIASLVFASHALVSRTGMLDESVKQLIHIIRKLTLRLTSEVEMQQSMSLSGSIVYQPQFGLISIREVFQEIEDAFSKNPVSQKKALTLPSEIPDLHIKTDSSLLLRIINNMITNAFEETQEGDEVKLWVEHPERRVVFCVWNRTAIPAEIARRLFQRNFSTKAESGRGLGTYSMKFFGERILGGKISFTSSEKEGTVFRFELDSGA